MKQEHKQLLIKDLCARIPYGVIVRYKSQENEGNVVLSHGNICHVQRVEEGWWSECKPYLRSMSSMTDEEREELSHLLPKYWSVEIDKLNNFYFDTSPSIFMEIDIFLNIIDWLNKKMFDYRGLIPNGLAIAVTKENNPYENNPYK